MPMKAVVQYALEKNAVELREVPRPVCGRGEVLVGVRAVSVCGSDLHQRANRQSWKVNVPVILGHEFAGVIAEADRDVTGFRAGDRVACETAAVICGRCLFCRSGQYQLCRERKGFGYGTNGAMTEYVCVCERILHHLPDSVSFDMAALTEPACVAYNAIVVRGSVRLGDVVLVLGPGPIGLLCLKMAALSGASSIMLAGLSSDGRRLETGRKFGAKHTVMLDQDDLAARVREVSGGMGADIVVDATGVSASLQTAMEAVKPGGAIVKVGWGPQPMGFSLDPLVQKAADIRASFSHNYPIWERVIHLMATGMLDLAPMIGARTYKLAEWEMAFDDMERGTTLKSVIRLQE